MNWQEGDESWAPSPEQLAAYTDGELDRCPAGAALKRRIEDWLADHPDAAAELQAQHHLAGLWKLSTALEPAESSWAGVWDRVNAAFLPPKGKRSGGVLPRRLGWVGLFLAGVAAALLVALNLPRPRTGGLTPLRSPPPARDVEPFPVVTTDDVEIIRVDGQDTKHLVVGKPPVTGELKLVGPDDVAISLPRDDGQPADMRVVGEESSPMIWTIQNTAGSQ
jgi:hypothetical protein